jgi:starch phosphorylase
MQVGDDFTVNAEVSLGALSPEDVTVELYQGVLDSKGTFTEPKGTEMTVAEEKGDGKYSYRLTMSCTFSGRQGYTVRVMPRDSTVPSRTLPGYIVWK